MHFVERFFEMLDEGLTPRVEEYCALVPEALREAVRSQCESLLAMRGALPPTGRVQLEGDLAKGRDLGDFRILREIGRGGMGVVYLALQRSLHRLVAVKVLPPHLSLSAAQVERFRREALAAAKLRHPAIVPIYAVGEEAGMHYFAMEYVRGASLALEIQSLRERRKEGRPPHAWERLGTRPDASYVTQVTEIVARVAEALDYAHKHGVIHRDVKPQNVLIDESSQPYLVDFGLAKDVDQASLSRSGDIAGTPHYMSPEQAMAKRVRVDHRTDVFSLGVVLYELLTLRRPFEGRTANEVFFQITFQDPKPIRALNKAVPRDLEVICFKAMEKSPERRFASAADMAADLKRFLRHESIVARPPSLFEIGRRRLVRHRLPAVAGASALAALAVGAFYAQQRSEARELAREMVPLRAAAGADLAARRAEELQSLQEAASRVRARFGGLPDEDERTLAGVEKQIRERARKWQAQGEALLAECFPKEGEEAGGDAPAAPGSAPLSTTPDRYWKLLSASALLQDAAALLPDDAELARRADLQGALPRLSVECNVDGARVALREFLPNQSRLGPRIDLGPAPLRELPVRPGYWRVIVEKPGWGFSELSRYLDEPGRHYRLQARILPTAQALRGTMQRFGDEPFVFGHPLDDENVLVRRKEFVEPFWLDEREATCRDYREFVEATGHRPPHWWSEGYRSEWDERPVQNVSWFDATTFAEWSGRRLPTQYEWERAARGTEGRRYPWGEEEGVDFAEVRERTNLGRPGLSSSREDRGRYLRTFLEGAEPVASRPEGRSPEGLYHLLDNVSEWTDTMYAFIVDGMLVPQPGFHVAMGGRWSGPVGEWTLYDRKITFNAYLVLETGVRCAKSERP